MLLRRGAVDQIETRLSQPGETLHAPHLFDSEVVQALRRLVLMRQVTERRGREALDDFSQMPIARYPLLPLLTRIWRLKQNLSVFDATYIALAEALDAPLVTADAALVNAPGHRARVELYHQAGSPINSGGSSPRRWS